VSDTAHFYYDLASPAAYLAAEQIPQLLPAPTEWHPVLERELSGQNVAAADASRRSREHEIYEAEVERRALELGLQPLRWPTTFPFDSELAMCVATYARSIGRGVAFAQAAFRQAFAGGRDLGSLDFVLIAAAACEMHPRAVLQSTKRASVRGDLERSSALAIDAGIRVVPTVRIGTAIFEGEHQLQRASAHATAAGLGSQK
jgi:2-hydroxychromene-2-carboxylate isomerase